jgi:hypothetical protein
MDTDQAGGNKEGGDKEEANGTAGKKRSRADGEPIEGAGDGKENVKRIWKDKKGNPIYPVTLGNKTFQTGNQLKKYFNRVYSHFKSFPLNEV